MAWDRLAPLTAFLRARLSPEGYLGLHLTLGALVMIAAGWLFGGIAEAVAGSNTISLIDGDIARWLHANANPPLTKFMLLITHVHGVLGIIVLSLLTGVVFLWKKEWYWLLGSEAPTNWPAAS